MSLPEGYRTTFPHLLEDEPESNEPEKERRAVAVPASAVRREQVEWLDAGRIPFGW